jgi:hypothetical protein
MMGRPRVSPPVVSVLPRSADPAATPSAPPGTSSSRKRPAESHVSSTQNEAPTLPSSQRLLGYGLGLTQPPVDPERPASSFPPPPRKVKARRGLPPGQLLLGQGLRLEPQPLKTSPKL